MNNYFLNDQSQAYGNEGVVSCLHPAPVPPAEALKALRAEDEGKRVQEHGERVENSLPVRHTTLKQDKTPPQVPTCSFHIPFSIISLRIMIILITKCFDVSRSGFGTSYRIEHK